MSAIEASSCPRPRQCTSLLHGLNTRLRIHCVSVNVLDVNGSVAGFIDFTQEFKYLGSITHSSLTSEADVDRRIKSATAAFGALKNIFINKNIDFKIKGRIYTAL
jgi:hypothetical protein